MNDTIYLPPITGDDYSWASKNHDIIQMRVIRLYGDDPHPYGKRIVDNLNFVSGWQRNLLTSVLSFMHRIIHDKKAGEGSLKAWGVPDSLIDRVRLMTQRSDQSFEEYIESMLGDKETCRVKKADLAYMLQLHLHPHLNDGDWDMLKQWYAGFRKLTVAAL
jgi:hypothetical protein